MADVRICDGCGSTIDGPAWTLERPGYHNAPDGHATRYPALHFHPASGELCIRAWLEGRGYPVDPRPEGVEARPVAPRKADAEARLADLQRVVEFALDWLPAPWDHRSTLDALREALERSRS